MNRAYVRPFHDDDLNHLAARETHAHARGRSSRMKLAVQSHRDVVLRSRMDQISRDSMTEVQIAKVRS